MQQASADTFWIYDTDYWLQQLNSSPKGLSQNDAEKKLQQSAYHKHPVSPYKKDVQLFLSQFKSPLMLLLIGAVILSAFLGDKSDVVIILFIILFSSMLSFLQERNAGRIIEKLQSMISLKTTVVRDGRQQEIESAKIVSGDVAVFNAGDMVPADCLLIDSDELHVNESSLTGESYPTRKQTGIIPAETELAKRTNCLWQGTNVISGTATALVIHTGSNTIFGSITQGAATNVETTFEKGIKDFGFFLMKITLFLSVFILIVNILNHKSVIESALFALALAVGMAPELLPAITTIAMSAGAKRLLAQKVIVKKLSSIQNLGEVNLLCTDKTGTITEGTISVTGMVDSTGNESAFVQQLAFWNATFESGYSNPIDEVLKQLKPEDKTNVEKIAEVPYDFIRKRLSIGIDTRKEKLLITKGAFTQIAGICTKVQLSADEQLYEINDYKTRLEKSYENYGKEGLRVIAICYKKITTKTVTKDDEKEMIFAGFILLQDGIKKGITDTIDALKNLQVKLKIITGDNKNVAQSIAKKIGIEQPVVLTGPELAKTSPEALKHLVNKTHIFAEVEPIQKEHIIMALRKSFTVAYIGDGINDVSAIKAADVGISVDNAVDVARESADFVLMEKNLMVLVEGIKEGRKTFANTLKYIYISTGSIFGNMCSVAAASLILPFLPMLPKQILLTNFLTDFPYLTIASDNVDEEQMKRSGKWDLKLIRNYMLIFGIHSSLFDIITFLTLLYFLQAKESAFQTGWFIESVLSGIFILLIVRTHKNFFTSRPSKYLLLFSIIGFAVTIALPYLPLSRQTGLTPLPLINLIAMFLIVLGYVLTADALKIWFFKRYRHRT